MTKGKAERMRWFGVGLIIVAVAFGLGFLVWKAPTKITDSYLMVVVAAAFVVLLLVMMVIGIAYKMNDLADPREAFGLPQGTIRAVIALFLLLIFIFLSIYLFRTMSEDEGTSPSRLPGLTSQQVLDLIRQGQSVSDILNDPGGSTVTVTVQKRGLSTETKQLATQIVTILGTLTTAVAAFYFGTKASSEPAGRRLGDSSPAPDDGKKVATTTPPNPPPAGPVALQQPGAVQPVPPGETVGSSTAAPMPDGQSGGGAGGSSNTSEGNGEGSPDGAENAPGSPAPVPGAATARPPKTGHFEL